MKNNRQYLLYINGSVNNKIIPLYKLYKVGYGEVLRTSYLKNGLIYEDDIRNIVP